MNPAVPPPADLALSLAALAGLFVLDRVLRAAGARDPLIRRFRFGLAAIMLVFLGRALAGLAGWGWLRSVEYVGAGLIPLSVLLLTEGLLRRHPELCACDATPTWGWEACPTTHLPNRSTWTCITGNQTDEARAADPGLSPAPDPEAVETVMALPLPAE